MDGTQVQPAFVHASTGVVNVRSGGATNDEINDGYVAHTILGT